MRFYYFDANEQHGPYAVENMQRMKRTGVINEKTLVCPEGGTEWLPYGSYKELKEVAAPSAAVIAAKAAATKPGLRHPAMVVQEERPREVPPVASAMKIFDLFF